MTNAVRSKTVVNW